MDSDTIIKLKSSDGKLVEISKKNASRSGLLKGLIEDFPDNDEYPVNQVNGSILEKVKEYLIHYQDEEPKKIEVPLKSNDFKQCIPEWDYNYLGEDIELIFNLLNASNYLDIKSLMELASAKLGSKIRGMISESIKKDFEIPETTKEENEQILSLKKYLEENSENF